MSKYFNRAILGNSHILACLDEKAELLRLYYPYIDYFQNIDAYQMGFVENKQVHWFHDAECINQYYDGNIVITKLKWQDHEVLIRDYVLMQQNVMVRKIKWNQPTSLLVYSKLKSTPDKLISGMVVKDALIQYCQDFYMATFSKAKIAKAQINNVQSVLQQANLSLEDYIGMSDNSAIMWEPEKEMTLYITLEKELKKSLQSIERMCQQREEDLYQETKTYWREFSETYLNAYIGEDSYSNREIDIIERSILMYGLLTNPETGAVLASPDVDETFTKCGRYGYCWPRDALFINQALLTLGMEEMVNRFYAVWAEKTQMSNGLFEQRYYSNGELAPSWGLQVDETASMVIGIGRLKHPEQYKEMVQKAVFGMIQMINHDMIASPCYDLWEERRDSHLYSTASIYQALKVAAEILKPFSEYEYLVTEIELLLPEIAKGIQTHFVANGKMKRCLSDQVPDISNLAVVVPFSIPGISQEIIENTVQEMEQALKLSNGGYLRYEGDHYMGGNAWVISSLWFAMYYLQQNELEKAEALYHWVTEHADEKGFLPEQLDRETGKTAWITQLSWSHALYLLVGKACKQKKKEWMEKKDN